MRQFPGYYLANGPGSPWLIFRLPVQPVHSEQPLMFELAGLLPEEVAMADRILVLL